MATYCVVAVLIIYSVISTTAKWHLAWEDDFNGGDLWKNWNFEMGCNGWGNNELQCYTDKRKENVRQKNGILTIQARREWWGDGQASQPFTSTRMISWSSFTYGKFEIRARLPRGKHLWPAFWMMPAHYEYGPWPRSGEIDIMEYRGQHPKQTLGTLHFGDTKENKGMVTSGERKFAMDFSKNFHVFGLDWSPTKMMWMVDGKVYHTESLQKNFWPGVYHAKGQPFDKPFNILINLAVGGSFFGGEPFDPIEADKWPKSTYEIDWIRKWEWRGVNNISYTE